MFRAFLAVLVALLVAPGALAAPLVVWMEAEVPDEKTLVRTDKKVGGGQHYAHVDLAFPPQPGTAADDEAYSALRDAVATGRARWDEFDVELEIASAVESAILAIDIVRSERDVQDIVDARLFQGAAVAKAFPKKAFLLAEEAAPYRVRLPGVDANLPWVIALGLHPDREYTRADVADGAAFPELQELQGVVSMTPAGTLDARMMPSGATLMLDGRVAEVGESGSLEIRPGEHYLHVVRNEVVAGRHVIRVDPGESVALPLAVDHAQLQTARNQVVAGTTTGFPDEVKAALDALMGQHEGPVFVAALDDGRISVLPYARGAQLLKKKTVTMLGVGEMGGGVVVSSLFDGSTGDHVTAPGVHGGLGLELGIWHVVLTGGMDLAFTPANTVTHANSDLTDNVTSSVLPQPWGGAGFYVLRPTGTTPALSLVGSYGWAYPAHMVLGGRLTFATPIDEEGTYFRVTAGGHTASKPMTEWRADFAGVPMHTLFLRVGLGALFF